MENIVRYQRQINALLGEQNELSESPDVKKYLKLKSQISALEKKQISVAETYRDGEAFTHRTANHTIKYTDHIRHVLTQKTLECVLGRRRLKEILADERVKQHHKKLSVSLL